MARTPDLERRQELLDRIVVYLADHGLAQATLRPMARSLDVSINRLVHHFGTKEELLAAAHAACFAMALSGALARNNTPAERLDVSATVAFEKVEAGWRVTTSKLTLKGVVPSLDAARFAEIAEGAKSGCPISSAISGNVAISLEITT